MDEPQKKQQVRKKKVKGRVSTENGSPNASPQAENSGFRTAFDSPSSASLSNSASALSITCDNVSLPAGSASRKGAAAAPRKRGRKRKSRVSDSESITTIRSGVNKIIIKRGSTTKTAPAPPVAKLDEPLDTKLRPSGKTADWDEFLNVGYNLHFVPPVTFFKNAPLREIWDELATVGKVVEVPNPFVRCPRPVNWIATIRHFAGYKALVEFETFDILPRHAAWMSFCSDVPKYLGYSDSKRILLYPPHGVRSNHPDFLEKAREFVENRATVAVDHGEIIQRHLKKTQKFPLLTMLEVMDRDCANRMRVATVTGTIGNRIHVTYVIEPRKDDIGYWFDVNSDYVHPIGWSQTVGHEIYGVPESAPFTPLPAEYFPSFPKQLVIMPGQMLEARHPLRPYLICAASIHQVLMHGYFVAEFKTNAKEIAHPSRFTFHVTSPFAFACGFCESNNIPIVPPFGESTPSFHWKKYLEKRKLDAAPLHLIPPRNPHDFKPGMKMEACGILDPTYLGPVTIRKVRAHLLYLSFDGWPAKLTTAGDAQLWSHAESSEIYPIGYAEMVGHNFQGCVVQADIFDDLDEQFSSNEARKGSSSSSGSSDSSSVYDS